MVRKDKFIRHAACNRLADWEHEKVSILLELCNQHGQR